MKDTIFVVLNSRRVDRITREKRPTLHAGEVAVELTINIADSYFVSNFPHVDVQLEEKHLIKPSIKIEPQIPPEEARQSDNLKEGE